MEQIFLKLMADARAKHGTIMPCGETFQSGLRFDGSCVQFWFNTPDHSTHLLCEGLAGVAS